MKEFLVVGVDVAKASLDLCIKPGGGTMHINNDQPGFKSWYRELKKMIGKGTKVVVIMEHTGSYSRRFERFLISKSIDYCKIPALQIKRSMGMTRGKNDKIDSLRIAEYGWLRKEQLKSDELENESIQKLKDLLSLRSKIVRDRSGYQCRLKEIKTANDYRKLDPMIRTHERIMATLTAELKLVEKQIRDLINSNTDLKQTSDLIRSVKGVGRNCSSIYDLLHQ
jgi:transposase